MTPWTRTSILLTSPGKCGGLTALGSFVLVGRVPGARLPGGWRDAAPAGHSRAGERTVSARQVLDAWEPLGAMANLALDAPMRAGILAELRDWALREWGDLDQPQSSTEHYRLEGVRVPGSSARVCAARGGAGRLRPGPRTWARPAWRRGARLV